MLFERLPSGCAILLNFGDIPDELIKLVAGHLPHEPDEQGQEPVGEVIVGL